MDADVSFPNIAIQNSNTPDTMEPLPTLSERCGYASAMAGGTSHAFAGYRVVAKNENTDDEEEEEAGRQVVIRSEERE